MMIFTRKCVMLHTELPLHYKQIFGVFFACAGNKAHETSASVELHSVQRLLGYMPVFRGN